MAQVNDAPFEETMVNEVKRWEKMRVNRC